MSEEPQGRPAALDVASLYKTYASMVYRRILRFFGPGEAEEVLQEVFVKVLENQAHFRGDAQPSTWLYQITTRHCLNRLRDQGRRQTLWRERRGDLWYGAHNRASQEARMLLAQLQETLPPELMTIAVYYHLDGLTHADIAKLMGVSRRTVGNRLEELEEAARRVAQTQGGHAG